MHLLKYSLRLILLLSIFLASACTSEPQATPTMGTVSRPAATTIPASPIPSSPVSASIPLVPFESQAYLLQGQIPKDWVEDTPGTYRPPQADLGSPVLYIISWPETSIDWVLHYLTHILPLAQPPVSSASRQTADFNWNLYQFDKVVLGSHFYFDIALSERGTSAYLVALMALKDDYLLLHSAAFEPIVETLKPFVIDQRDKVNAMDLQLADYPDPGPVNNAYFTPLGEQAAAITEFEGRLSVPAFEMEVKSPPNSVIFDGAQIFPGFSAGFFTYEDYLAPVEQDILPPADPKSFWKVILSPGKVWSEAGDGGKSRAAFPFVLVSTLSNETHNGIGTFLYDEKEVSALRIQVVQETMAPNKPEMWGQTWMDYTPEAVEDRGALAEQFAVELQSHLPTHPWLELEEQFDPAMLDEFTGGVDKYDISATGLVLDDVLYLQPCYTRYGEFPFCQFMRHGAFSVTKSMGALTAMLRLAEKYGEGVFDLKVTDYVTLTARHDGWKDVTFADALNMATGIGDNPSEKVDDIASEEFEPKWQQFAMAQSTQEKLDVISTYGQYPWGPGEVARYNSTNTFVLAVAMQRFLQSKEGPQADIWDTVSNEVYRPIGITQAPIMRTIEPDGSRGIPILGYGLYPTVQDVARLAILLWDGGKAGGEQLLHAGKLAEALEQIEQKGLPNGVRTQFGEGRYFMSFWFAPYRTEGGNEFMVPYMSGYGGNRVVLNPNGVITFRFADAMDYDVMPLIRVAEGIKPFP